MSGGWRAIWRRSSAGVSPVRLATVMCGTGSPRRSRGEGDAGQRRAQVALDVVGQRLERRDVQDADRAGRLAGRRRARVGREPVEASRGRRPGSCHSPSGRGSACAGRSAMASQPRACASVGASKLARNQSRTAGEKGASGSAIDGDCGHGRTSVPRGGYFDQMFGSVGADPTGIRPGEPTARMARAEMARTRGPVGRSRR